MAREPFRIYNPRVTWPDEPNWLGYSHLKQIGAELPNAMPKQWQSKVAICVAVIRICMANS
jgi:hypothetical protein